MKLNKKLNLVIPIYGAPTKTVDESTGKEVEVDNVSAYVHAMPISAEVFDKYAIVIGKTFAAIYGGGLGLYAGPRLAAKLLRKVATESGEWDGPEGVEAGLVAEMRQRANVVAKGPNGWESVPFDSPEGRARLDDEDVAEVENSLAFFTVASSMHRRHELPAILSLVSAIWGAQTSSSSCTEFASSLRTSTAPATIGAKATPSLIPS